MAWSSNAWLLSPYLLVAIGGAVGSVLRYSVGRWVVSWASEAPTLWATGIVNLVGSFALGCLLMALSGSQRTHPMVLLLGVGLCGGFTTFSTLSMEVAELLQERRWDLALAYGIGSLLCGWLAFVLGAWFVGSLTLGGPLDGGPLDGGPLDGGPLDGGPLEGVGR